MTESNAVPNSNDDSEFLDEFASEDAGGELDLTCPGCESRLNDDLLFKTYRICSSCRRHFWITARERLALMVDQNSFRERNAELVSIDPLVFRDAWSIPDRLVSARSGTSYPVSESVITGLAQIGGRDAVLAIVDLAHFTGSIGMVAGEKIALAIEDASNRRIPLIVVCSGGMGSGAEGVLSLAQIARIAGVIGKLQRNGIPFISVLTHPATGAIYAGLANHANILFAEPAAQIGLGSTRTKLIERESDSGTASAEFLLERGMIDGIIDRPALRDRLVSLLDMLTARGTPRASATPSAVAISMIRSADELAIARNADRPTSLDYVQRLMPGFVEIRGDRIAADDPAVIAGLGQIDGVTIGVVGLQRRRVSAAGFRKIVRLHRMAAQMELPVVSLVDTIGIASSDELDHAALANSIAQLTRASASLPVPTVVVNIGEAAGAGALAISIADRVMMLEHAVLSVSGFATSGQAPHAPAGQTFLTATLSSRDCLRLGMIDSVVPEPAGGAHLDPNAAAQHLRLAVIHALSDLSGIGPRRLLDERSRKLRHLGLGTPAGREALRLEIVQLQELQQTVGRSIEELRERIEHYQLGLPSLPSLPQRPPMPHVALPVFPSLPTIKRPTVNRAEISGLAVRLAATGRGIAGRVSEVRESVTSAYEERKSSGDNQDAGEGHSRMAE